MKTVHFRRILSWIVALALPAVVARGGETEALLQILVRKGLLTESEAAEVRAEMAAGESTSAAAPTPVPRAAPATPPAATQPAPVVVKPAGKLIESLALSGRVQVQAYALGSDRDVPAANRFILRRVYLGAKAATANDWSVDVTYDFAGAGFDKAVAGWTGDLGFGPVAVQAGLRKTFVSYEENLSSGSLNAIERSGATRYFVESNNGRRLGAGGYRTGVFFEGNPDAIKGKTSGWYYGVAVTNPERPADAVGAGGGGSPGINSPALWAHTGFSGRINDGSFLIGATAGRLPDSGGRIATASQDLLVYTLYADLRVGAWRLAGEYLGADVEGGLGIGADSSPDAFWVQGEYAFDARWMGVLRYSQADSAGRGVRTSDGVRSAPSDLVGDKLDELYAGFNYDLKGTDLRFQLGYVYGRASGNAAGDETVTGVRSQVQVNF